MKYKGIEITPAKRPNEPYCNSCGDSGERWKVRICLDEVGGNTVILCTDCLQALKRMAPSVKKHPQYINRDLCGAFVTVCPSCERELADESEQENFCPSCGQALDWSVIEGLDDN